MANEQLLQSGYLSTGTLRGEPFGPYELLNLGATTARELIAQGIRATIPISVNYHSSSMLLRRNQRTPSRTKCILLETPASYIPWPSASTKRRAS